VASIVKKNRRRKPAYFVVYRIDGKQLWKYAGQRRGDAEKLKAKIEHGIHTSTHQEMPDINFKELADKWLSLKKSEVRPKTFASYIPHIKRQVEQFGSHKVKNINQEMVESWFAELKKKEAFSPETIGRGITLLKGVFRKGMQWGYLGRNPAEFIAKPKAQKTEVEFLEPDEIKRLIKEADPRYRCLIMFACLTGCRISEILGLRWSDVDFNSSRIFIRQTLQGSKFFEPKSAASRRAVDIPPIMVEALKIHQARLAVELPSNDHDLVFPNLSGKPMDSQGLRRRRLEPALKRAGIRQVGFHALRHSYISMLIAQGENVKTIQQLAGHSSAKITWDTYGHLFEGTTKKAVNKLSSTLFSGEKELQKEEERKPQKNF